MSLAAAAVTLALLGGCTSSTGNSPSPPPAQSSPEGTQARPPDSPEATALATLPTATPAATSGPLDAAAVPEPAALGAGWAYRVEGGDPDDGGPGNDTPFQARDPLEIVETTLPMGCERRSPSPAPLNVLQATYRHRASGSFAVALRMRFDDAADAGRFAQLRQDDLRACRDQPDDPYSGAPAPVLSVREAAGGWSTARYRLVGESDIWTSGLVVRGTDVLTLDADADAGLLDWDAALAASGLAP